MPWSAEAAMNELWSGLDITRPAGDVRAHLKRHLQAAFDAGRAAEQDGDGRLFGAFLHSGGTG